MSDSDIEVTISSMTIRGSVPMLLAKVPTPRRMGEPSPVLGLTLMRRPATWPSSEEVRSWCIIVVSLAESTMAYEAVERSLLMRW